MNLENKIKMALKHKNVLGAGARSRRQLHLNRNENIQAVMTEFKRHRLHSGSGAIVNTKAQAIAISLNESRTRRLN